MITAFTFILLKMPESIGIRTAEQRGMSFLGWERMEISWDPVLALYGVEGVLEGIASCSLV